MCLYTLQPSKDSLLTGTYLGTYILPLATMLLWYQPPHSLDWIELDWIGLGWVGFLHTVKAVSLKATPSDTAVPCPLMLSCAPPPLSSPQVGSPEGGVCPCSAGGPPAHCEVLQCLGGGQPHDHSERVLQRGQPVSKGGGEQREGSLL